MISLCPCNESFFAIADLWRSMVLGLRYNTDATLGTVSPCPKSMKTSSSRVLSVSKDPKSIYLDSIDSISSETLSLKRFRGSVRLTTKTRSNGGAVSLIGYNMDSIGRPKSISVNLSGFSSLITRWNKAKCSSTNSSTKKSDADFPT